MTMRPDWALILMLLGPALAPVCASAAEQPRSEPAPAGGAKQPLDPKVNGGILPADYQGRPLLWIPKLKAPEKLSGGLSGTLWKEAAAVDMRDIVTKEQPKHKTEAFLFCTDDALYLGFRCQDEAPEKVKTDGGELWKNDGVEIFIEPDKDALKKPYHQIIVDASGALAVHRHHVYPLHGSKAIKEEWEAGVEAVAAKGEKCWTCEVRIPFAKMKLSQAAKDRKTLWRLNLYRSRPERDEEPRMESGWSPPGNSQYHCAAKFGFALPEVYASPALIAEAVRDAGKAAAATPRPEADPAVCFEIRKKIGELSSEVYAEREGAAERLKALGALSAAHGKTLAEELQAAIAKSRDEELVTEVKKILSQVKQVQALQDDDDPPPESLLQAEAPQE